MMTLKMTDFGNVPVKFHAYMLISAGLAYLANLVCVALLVNENLSEEYTNICTACILFYYTFQVAFIPLVRKSTNNEISKTWVRILLVVCIIPIAVLTAVSFQTSNKILQILSIFVLSHVSLNDALLYGLLF